MHTSLAGVFQSICSKSFTAFVVAKILESDAAVLCSHSYSPLSFIAGPAHSSCSSNQVKQRKVLAPTPLLPGPLIMAARQPVFSVPT